MRPLRLTVEGFTSFRDRLELDFSGLDLFALTGPTGVGKSSLIDAMVFALFGQVPRVGDDYKQLVSHGAERMSVLFELSVGGKTYRIARVVRRAGASQQRMEQVLDDGTTRPLADKVREIRNEVEKILGLDYDGFTRSVVLPQGQFDSFLKGEPKERRKILVALLNLGVYERMQQIANRRSSEARTEAEFVKHQLETDYLGVSALALAEYREQQAAAGMAVVEASRALDLLGKAATLAQTLRQERRDVAAVTKDEASETEALRRAAVTVTGAAERRTTLASRLEVVKRDVLVASEGETRLAALAAAAPLAQQLEQRTLRLARLAAEGKERETSLRSAEGERAAAEATLLLLEERCVDARRQEDVARAQREGAHRADLAGALRRGLRPGETCPVCEQPVALPPKAGESGLDDAEVAVAEAEAVEKAATLALERHRVAISKREMRVESLRREVAQAELERQDASGVAASLRVELDRLGFLEREALDPPALVLRIAAERRALDGARATRERLEGERALLEREILGLEAAVAAAAAQRELAREREAALRCRREAAEARMAAAREELLALTVERSLAEVGEPPPGSDEVDVVEAERAKAQGVLATATGEAATTRERVEHMERSLLRVEELRERRQTLEQRAAVHKTLAEHLKANELVAWIQEEALRRLAEGGSEHLARLSQSRYALQLGAGDAEAGGKAEQEFFVVDHWNGDAIRSVRTLSGGETFLASLALALALAASLTDLSVEGTDVLESLFLDEGFGTLDSETLDAVVSALDTLHGGQRMVGIVTHVRELAERLPARLEVRRQGSVSTAVVV